LYIQANLQLPSAKLPEEIDDHITRSRNKLQGWTIVNGKQNILANLRDLILQGLH
jgi:hypothetical protein